MPPKFDPTHTALNTLLKVAKDNRGVRAAVGIANEGNAYRHLKTLDQEFGCRIREPNSNPATLTAEGHELAGITQQYLAALDDFRRRCRGRGPEIGIGAGDSIMNRIVSPVLKEFLKGKSVFSLRVGGEEGLALLLRGGLIDFAIVPAGSRFDKMWKSEPIGVYEYCVCCSRALLGASELNENVLSTLEFAVMWDHWGLDFVGKARSGGVELNVKFTCETFSQVETLVRSGPIAGILPLSTMPDLPEESFVWFRPAFMKQTDRWINLVWRKGGAYTRDCVKDMATPLLKHLKAALKESQNVPAQNS